MDDLFKKPWLIVIVASIIISAGILVAGGVDFGFPERDVVEDKGEDADVVANEVVVTVEDISFGYLEYSNLLEDFKMQATMEGREQEEGEAEREAVEMLINQGVIIKYAEQEGISPSDECIEDRIQEMVLMYEMTEDDLERELVSVGIEVEEYVRHEIMITRLYDKYVEEFEISDEELKGAYEEYIVELEQMGLEEEDMPSFEEAKDFMRDDMAYEKASDMLFEKAEELRDEFKIEVMLDDFDFDF